MVLATAGEICGYIDNDLTNFIHTVIVIIEIATIVLLIIFGMLDFAKGVIASKEEETKKGMNIFIKRCISAIIVFFVFSITQLLTGIIAKGDSEIWACASAILNGSNKGTSAPKNNSTDDIDNLIEEVCCTQAGGKINNSTGTCSSWFDMDEDGNTTTRHEVDTDSYNQCKKTQNQNKGKVENKGNTESCCTQAGGKIDNNGVCIDWLEMDNAGTPIKKHEVDEAAYNRCTKN